jgi:uncharacterized protein YegL
MSDLTEFNFIVAVDCSGSMGETDAPGGRSRWAYMQESLLAFTRDVQALDSDGIDLVIFGGSAIDSYRSTGADKLKEILATRSPRGGTPLADALHTAFNLANGSDKKAFVLFFTDGIPDDKAAAAAAIIKQANAQETDDECTVLFVQVGHDPGAAAYLKSLDDDLKGAKFDIVDALTIEEAEKFPTITALVEKAIAD